VSSDDVHPIRFESTAARLRAALDGPWDLNGRADDGGLPLAGLPAGADADLLGYLRDKARAGRLERGATVPAPACVLAAAVEEALR